VTRLLILALALALLATTGCSLTPPSVMPEGYGADPDPGPGCPGMAMPGQGMTCARGGEG
jgi:hypothetical protein